MSSARISEKNVNRLRTENGLTQEQLAERADMSRRFLQEVEKGEKIPTVKSLHA